MKRHFATALGVLVSAASLFIGGCGGCGNDDIIIKDTDKPQTAITDLRLLGYKVDSTNLKAIEKTFSSFLEDNQSFNVVYEGIRESEYYTAFEKRRVSGKLSDAFMINGNNYLTLINNGHLADISDAIDAEAFNPSIKEQFTDKDGKVYFMPACVSTYNLYINYDLLKRENVAVPKNYSEFTAACNYFVSKNVTPLIINNYASLMTLIKAKGLSSVYQSDNVSQKMASFNENPLLLKEYLSDGIDLVSQFIGNGWINKAEAMNTEQASDDIDLFVKGERPFMITGGWASQRVKNKFSTANPKFDYGVHPYPILADDSVLVVTLDDCIAVNKDGANLAETKKLLSYMSEPSTLYDFCDSQSSFIPLQGDKMPSDKTLAPSYSYYTSGKSIAYTDYRLTIEGLDSLVTECGSKLLKGESKEVVISYLEAELIKRGGSKA